MGDDCIINAEVLCGFIKKAMFISVILFLISVGGVGATVNIDTCRTINTSGVYVLNTSITNSSASICIRITSSNVIFDGQGYTIDGINTWYTYGVYVYNSSTPLTNVTVKNLNVTDWYDGIWYGGTDNGSIIDNTASSNGQNGIYLGSSSNNILTNNTASNNKYGITLQGSSNNNTISNNTASLNSNIGIFLLASNNNNIITNNALHLNTYGVYLSQSSNNNISNNVIDNSTSSGFYFATDTTSYYNTITGNIINGDTYYHLVNEDSIVLENLVLTAEKPSNLGWVSVINSTNVTLRNLKLANNTGSPRSGLYLYQTSSSSISNITSYSNYYGIYLRSSANNIIAGSNASSNGQNGIHLSSSSNNTITNNNASSNDDDGIFLSYSSDNTLTNNTMSANTYNFYVAGSSISHFVQTIDTTNTVDGKPIYYFVGASDMVVDASTGAGYVGVVNGINVTVKDLTLVKNSYGVLFVNTSNSSVSNVNASNNRFGIYIFSSSNNTLTNNTANSNKEYGIYLKSSL